MITLPYTEIIDLKSNYNEVEYSLFVRLPNDYKTSNKAYPKLVFARCAIFVFSLLWSSKNL